MRASIASHRGASCGELKAIAAMPATRLSWVMMIHPLRLPNHGGTKRSISGDQRNFRAYGNPINANMPIVRKSTPETVIHA